VWSNFFKVTESLFVVAESRFKASESLLPDSATANCAENRSENNNINRNHIGDLDAQIKQFTPNMFLWFFNFHYLLQITIKVRK
jgi:hypothetical protein